MFWDCKNQPYIKPRSVCWYCILRLLWGIFLCAGFTPSVNSLSQSERDQLQSERAAAAKAWAPIVHLHPDETIFPTAVHTFLQNVEILTLPKDEKETPATAVPISRSLDTKSLPEGEASKDTYLVAPIDPDCGNCPLPPYLLGEKPTKNYAPPIYAVISSCLPEEEPEDNPFRRMGRGFRRPRFGRRITDTIIRASRHIRDRYFKGRRKSSSAEAQSSSKVITVSLDDPQISLLNPTVGLHPPPGNTMGIEELRQKLEEIQKSSKDSKESDSFAFILNSRIISRRSDNETNSIEKDIIQKRETKPKTSSKVYKVFKQCSPNEKDCLDVSSSISHTNNQKSKEQKSSATEEEHSHENTISEEHFDDIHDESIERKPIVFKDSHKFLKPRKGHHFTITYWMFYPYSRGKPVCTSKLWLLGRVFKPRLRNKCYGEEVTLNDHVGDWEHMSIFFQNGLPQRMYVSSHFYGAFYQYVPGKHLFEYRGKDARHPLPVSAKFPATIKLKGTHPVVFSALGSHGLWGGPGVHRYMNFIPLEDVTSLGTTWRTWDNIDVVDYRDPQHDREDRQWLRFQGRWGNPSHECYKGLFGICTLSKGPTGIPNKRANFPCNEPQHSTFHPDSG